MAISSSVSVAGITVGSILAIMGATGAGFLAKRRYDQKAFKSQGDIPADLAPI